MIWAWLLLAFFTFSIGYIFGFVISDIDRKIKEPTLSDIRKSIAESDFSSTDEMHHPNKGKKR